jgi:hypothetical protein
MRTLADQWDLEENFSATESSNHAGEGDSQPLPTPRPLVDIAGAAPDPASTLLGERYLCRGGGLVIVAPSGVGKSTMSIQQDILWGLGRPAFGIAPSKPLKILTIQAENDDGDVYEAAAGTLDGLGISESERKNLREMVFMVHETSRTGAAFFVHVLKPLLREISPDLVRLDPLLAYLGGDPVESPVISRFCRNCLNPLLEEFSCGAVIVHHTPKTTNRQTDKWRPSDWSYSGAGAAELTNWARAMIAIEPTADSKSYRFIAAKRGQRIGWRDEFSGQPVLDRFFRWAADGIYWDAVTDESDVQNLQKSRNSKTPDDLLKVIPATSNRILKEKLIELASERGIGQNKTRNFLKILIEEGKAKEVKEPRSGRRPAIFIAKN